MSTSKCYYNTHSDHVQNGCDEQIADGSDGNNGQEAHRYTHTAASWTLKPNTPGSADRAGHHISLNKATNLQEHSFELQNRGRYNQNPPSTEERSMYQPLNPQNVSDDVTSSTYQSLTHSTKQRTAPVPPIPSKENAYQNLPCRSKHHPLKKARELCFEEVVIKKRQS